jgi:hydroxymethylpyrimidine pyrophosphatase-like HAD family hydrolase
MICCNGGYLYDPAANRISNGDLIPADGARDILAFIREYCPDLAFRVSSPYSVRSETAEGIIAKDLASFDPGTVEISAPAEAWPMDDWYKIVMRGEGERLAEAKRAFERVFGDRLKATTAGAHLWEVQSPHVHKALGLEKLRKVYNGAGNDRILIACGDQENDLAMLKAAPISVAMGQATDLVKSCAKYITASVEEDGAALLLENLP